MPLNAPLAWEAMLSQSSRCAADFSSQHPASGVFRGVGAPQQAAHMLTSASCLMCADKHWLHDHWHSDVLPGRCSSYAQLACHICMAS